MKNSRIAQTLRSLSVTPSLENDGDVDANIETGPAGEGTVKVELEEAQTDQADAPGEDKEVTAKTVEVGERADNESAETDSEDSVSLEGRMVKDAVSKVAGAVKGKFGKVARLERLIKKGEDDLAGTKEMIAEGKTELAAAEAKYKADKTEKNARRVADCKEYLGELKEDIETINQTIAALKSNLADAKAKVSQEGIEDDAGEVEVKMTEVGERADNESAETESEDSQGLEVSQEGFTGGLIGWVCGTSGWVPFVGPTIHAVAKTKRLKLREDIQTIAKRIEKIRAGQIEKAAEEGLELPKKLKHVDFIDIIKSAVFGQFFGSFYGAWQGSDLQNLNNELQAKLKELETELNAAGIATESLDEDAADAAVAAARGVAQGAAAAAEAVEAAIDGGDAGSDVAEAPVVEEAPAEAEAIAEGETELEEVAGDIEDLEGHAEKYENAAATMEALIEGLRDAQQTGGLNPQAARFFNITFEHIGTELTGRPFQNAHGESAIPSLESFGGTMRRDQATTISMEAAENWFQKILEVLKKTWAQVVEWVKKFVAAVFSQSARYSQRADALIAASKKIGNAKPKSAKIKFGAADKIAVGNKVSIDSLETVAAVAGFVSVRAKGAEGLSEGFSKMFSEVSSKLNSITDKEGWEKLFLGAMEIGLSNIDKGGADQARSALFKNRRTEGLEVIYSTDVLPGNVRLEMHTPEISQEGIQTVGDGGPAAFVKAAIAKTVKQNRTYVKEEGVELSDTDRELPTLNAQQIASLAEKVKRVLAGAANTKAQVEKLRTDFRASIPANENQSAVARAVVNSMASSASKNLSDYCGGVSKALKYAIGTSGVFLDYAAASAKQYGGKVEEAAPAAAPKALPAA